MPSIINDIAVVVITCDKYSVCWDAWYNQFKRNFRIDVPVYFITETIKSNFYNVTDVNVGVNPINQWTQGLKTGLSFVREENVFLLLEDQFFVEDITKLFRLLYASFMVLEADSLRINFRGSAATVDPIDISFYGVPIRRLKKKSKYLISYMPCIWRKDFLLSCLGVSESPWDSEVKGSKRISKRDHKIYEYTKFGWAVDVFRRGVITDDGKLLLHEKNKIQEQGG